MQADDNVHAIFIDSIGRDCLQIVDLVSRVELRAWNFDPGCIVSRDPKGAESCLGQLVNSLCSDERRVSLLEYGSTARAKMDTETPFVSGVAAVLVPKGSVKGFLLDKPCPEVGAVGLESFPIDVSCTGSSTCHTGSQKGREK